MRGIICVLVFLSSLAQPGLSQDEPLSQMKVVRITNGSNAVDLDGNGLPDLVVLGWLENYNAHGYEIFTFYVHNPAAREHPLNVVVFADSGGREGSDVFRTSRGADCILTDLRVLQPRVGPAVVVVGRRDLGQSYADSQLVTFSVYRLRIYDEGVPGLPPFQFISERTVRSKARYCDVGDAFSAELGLGPYQ